jgi:GH24 family phage-related lysozyme (muramidase)
MATTIERITVIQTRLGLKGDGIVGPVTLSAIERLLDQALGAVEEAVRLTCSLIGLEALVELEISSQAYYNRYLKNPTWPGGASGVTIGIGYDLGYCSAAAMRRDWRGKIADEGVESLEQACRLKADKAKAMVNRAAIRRVTVPLGAAREVFYAASLPNYAEKCLKAYPGVERLPADAQAAMLSLVFNRGTAMSGSRRREMKALKAAVAAADLGAIAEQLQSMKRLWLGKKLDGLLVRRDREADLVLGAQRPYGENELVKI